MSSIESIFIIFVIAIIMAGAYVLLNLILTAKGETSLKIKAFKGEIEINRKAEVKQRTRNDGAEGGNSP